MATAINAAATAATAATAGTAGSSSAPTSYHKPGSAPEDGNQVWIGTHKRPLFYADIALEMFVRQESVELHGLGEAIAPTIEVAEHLIHLKKATLTKLHTGSVAATSSGHGSRPEIVISIKRTGIPQLPKHTPEEEEYIKNAERQEHS